MVRNSNSPFLLAPLIAYTKGRRVFHMQLGNTAEVCLTSTVTTSDLAKDLHLISHFIATERLEDRVTALLRLLESCKQTAGLSIVSHPAI